MKNLIVHTILGYQFWTLFQAIAPMIWFYPLNELEISGYEAFALVVFSPLLLSLSFVESFFTCKYVRAIIRILSTLGILSFQAPSTLHRLVALMASCFFQMLSFALSLHSDEKEETIKGTSVGLLLLVASRVWLRSFVPAWWDNTCNLVVFTVCLIATLDVIHTSLTTPPSQTTPSKTPPPSSQPQIPSPRPPLHSQPPQPHHHNHWLMTSLCFGSLFYTTHAIFGEASVLSRWTVQGYPHTGPMPFPWGAAVLCGLCTGMYASSCAQLVHSHMWWLCGCVSLCLMYLLHTWPAFIAGCILSCFLTSIWPSLLSDVSNHPPYKVLPLSMLVWLLQMLFSVWTTAYNFVPGGIYTRERTGSLIVSAVAAFILYAATKKKVISASREQYKGQFNKLILVALLIGLAGFVYRIPMQSKGSGNTVETSHSADTHSADAITCAIWTFHFGYDNQGWPSMTRAASMLKALDADVITLLESDASKPYLGNNDLAMWLSEELKMFVDFGPSTSSHTWGNLLLSKHPIVHSTHLLLPSPHGELAPAISATIDVEGRHVDLVVTHMGNDGDNLDRNLQAQTLTGLLKNASNPAVFLGYVTSAPYSRDYRQLTSVAKDIDPTDLKRWCQYIMYKNLTRLAYARISHGGLSDTEIQVGRFGLGEPQDHPLTTTDPNHVPPSVRFTSEFGSHRQGHYYPYKHHYHMGTPKYFLNKAATR